MIYAGRTRAEIADLAKRLVEAAAAAERYTYKARIWATERDRVLNELVKLVANSQDEVSVELMPDQTVERPRPEPDPSTTPHLPE